MHTAIRHSFAARPFAAAAVTAALGAATTLANADTIRHMADTYLKSDGTQFIDTGIYVTTNMCLEAEFEPELDSTSNRFLFGSYGAGSDMTYGIFIHQSQGIKFCAGTYANGDWIQTDNHGVITAPARYKATYNMTERTILLYAEDSWQFNNSGNKMKGFGSAANNCTLGIFGNHESPTSASMLFKGKLYSLRIHDNGELAHDFVPYGRGAVTGLLDRCTGKVHVNTQSGANPFVLGTDDGFLRSNRLKRGGQFLDTGYTVTPDTKIEVDFSMADILTGQQRIFGADKGTGLCCGFYIEGANTSEVTDTTKKYFKWAFQDDAAGGQATGVAVDSSRRTFTLDAPNRSVTLAKANGAVEYSGTIGTTFTKNGYTTLRLFGNAVDNGAGVVALTNGASVKIYRMRIWNGGTLVRDYTPRVIGAYDGLYDNVQRKLDYCDLSGTSNTGKYRHTTGGAVEAETLRSDFPADAYLESTGSQTIDTGCLLSLQSKLEMDASLLDFGGTAFLFGTGAGVGNNGLYHQNGSARSLSMLVYNGSASTWPWLANNILPTRVRVAMDFANAQGVMTTPNSQTTPFTLPSGSLGDTGKLQVMGVPGAFASMRLYAFKIYEGGNLVHDYVPCSQGGVAGVWDLVAKEFRANSRTADGSGFTVCGAGVNGSGMAFMEQPQGCRLLRGESTTLSAFAPGAVCYQWFRNGELVEGATGRTLEVAFGTTDTTDTYQCVANYNIFGYAVSAEAQVENIPGATVMTIR